MESDEIGTEAAELRKVMQAFVGERLELKLVKLKPDELEKREALVQSYQLDAWLSDAVRRVGQIQLATHILKPMHPEARGTNLHVADRQTNEPGLVGTHSLSGVRANDVVGNAAALDVFKFLSLQCEGVSLLDRVLKNDAGVKVALSDDPAQAEAYCSTFATVTQSKGPEASHTLAKQLYFPLGEPGEYHLLAPLFPTTLVHQAYGTMREHRYGDSAKEAREARRKKEPCSQELHEYPNLAIQNFGGTKPQNISQLNSERHGENWLLASLPPSWDAPKIVVPLRTDSVFENRFGAGRHVRNLTYRLKTFLRKTNHNNVSIRALRAKLVEEICDEALQYAASLRELEPGWSAQAECRLNESEKLWLDPGRVDLEEEFAEAYKWRDWPSDISSRFANWLNHALSSKGSVLGDADHDEWKKELHGEVGIFRDYLEDYRD